MSAKQFETFLVEQFLANAESNINAGFRYQFKSPDNKNSQRLFAAMLAKSDGQIGADNGVKLDYFNVASCKIVPVVHCEESEEIGFTENYISHLRDEVASQEGYLKGCALVVIHNSLLDTLINSAEDLAQPGQVWSPEKIKTALSGLIDNQDQAHDVSVCLLDDQFDAILEDGATMFGFESLYKAVQDGDLRFTELGMLEDPLVVEMKDNKKQIKKRLEDNRALFEELSFEVEHFGEQLEDRLKTFGSKFIKEHFSDGEAWKDVPYETFVQEAKRNVQQHLVLEGECETSGAEIVGRYKAESKAGMRERHLIVLVDEDTDQFELKLTFQGASNIAKEQFKISHCKELVKSAEIAVRNSVKGASATFKAAFNHEPLFFSLGLKRDNKAEVYNFRCLVLPKGQFHLEPFKNFFFIEPGKKRITLKTEDNQLAINSEGQASFCLTDSSQIVDSSEYGVVDFESLANESDEIDFFVKSGDNQLKFNVEGAVSTDSLSLPLLLNRGRFVNLFKDNYYGEFFSKKGKVGIDNSEFVVPAMRLKLLRWEEQFVQEKMITIGDAKSLSLEDLKLVDDAIHQSYLDLYHYLAERRTTLSLVSWGPEFYQLAVNVVDAFLAYFNSLPTGSMLTKAQKTALKVGLVSVDGDEFYSPFHPLVLAYYTNLCKSITEDQSKSFSKLPDVTFDRLNPQGLLPYVYHPNHEFSYNQQVKENAFWLKSVPHQKSSLSFVRKLVKEKIDEFQTAFSQLFTGSEKSMIVNAVNQDKASELFLGLVDYVRHNLDHSASIHVNLYDDSLTFNAFDQFAETANYEELKEWLELNKGKVREQADTIIDILRTRLTYSKFTNKQTEQSGQAYSHLTFFRNNDKVDFSPINIDDMTSGIACDGLLAGEASQSQHGSYFTAFGLKGVDYQDKPHLQMAKFVGSLTEPALKSNTPYHGANAPSLAVSEDFKSLLERSYDSAIWTTIIDPKVTLDFFQANQDVVLIHYSDQYTSSASYDAITVTAQRNLFEKVLEQGDGGQINEFNAFNGDWLLKMMTCSPTIHKERKGVIGAYKFVTSLVHNSDITWVPLSVAEMIRVSGNIGLKMSDSEFSRNVQGYKKGAISDDVLLVGFKGEHMYLLPVEVKTGSVPNYNKAVEQTKELLRYLSEDLLGNKTLANKLYRGLFIRQVLMQIDKYSLYQVFDETYFQSILDNKEMWLQGDYEIASITDYPEGMVISHLEGASCIEPNYEMVDGILKVDLPMSLLPMLVEKPLQELMNETDVVNICHVPSQYVLDGETSISKGENTMVQTAQTQPTPAEVTPLYGDIEPTPAQKVAEQTVEKEQPVGNDNLQVLFGHNAVTQAPLQWEPTNTAKFMNTNTGIIGTMGTGKTQFTKSVITQLHRNRADNVDGKPIGMLIFDYKSDYVDDKFQNATEGKKYNLHKLPYNPLSLFGDTPMLPVHTARGFSETMGKAFGLGQKQQLRLRKLVGEAYELAGIRKADSSTWSKAAPTIADVWALFIETEPDEDSLYAALESLYELEIFEDNQSKCESLYDLVDGIRVVELAGYPSEIQNLVVALTLDLFYSQMQKKGKPEVKGDFRQVTKMILVDEADNFMSQNFPSLRKILKEGREYGVGTILSTQDITHFQTGENDYSSYVLTWVIHRVAKIKPQDLKAMFSVNEKLEQEKLMETINKLEKHYSLYIDGAKKIVKMRDRAFWELLQ